MYCQGNPHVSGRWGQSHGKCAGRGWPHVADAWDAPVGPPPPTVLQLPAPVHDRLHFLHPSRSRLEGPPRCHRARAGPHPSVSVSQGSPGPGIADWLRNPAGLVLGGMTRCRSGLSGEVHPTSHEHRSLGRAFWHSQGSSGASPELGRSLVRTWGKGKMGGWWKRQRSLGRQDRGSPAKATRRGQGSL